METLQKERAFETREPAKKHFDILASVRSARYDLQTFGYILPETKDQILDEELTYIAEGIDRPLSVPFVLPADEHGQLLVFQKGKWRPYMNTLENGMQSAQNEVDNDPRKSLLVEMAAKDYHMGQRMEALAVGERLLWYSPYPYLEESRHGSEFVGKLGGFQPDRKMAFMYEAVRLPDGSVSLFTKSVDNSDEDAFEAAMDCDSLEDAALTYDRVLSAKTGKKVKAGRFLEGKQDEKDAWDIIHENADLVEYLFHGISRLAEQTGLCERQLEIEKKKLTYGVWAAIKARINDDVESNKAVTIVQQNFADSGGVTLETEVATAYKQSAARAEVMYGCGGSISATSEDETLLGLDTLTARRLIFGKEQQPPKKMRCIECRDEVDRDEVVKKDSWRCPTCKYEVDICTGKVIRKSTKATKKRKAKVNKRRAQEKKQQERRQKSEQK